MQWLLQPEPASAIACIPTCLPFPDPARIVPAALAGLFRCASVACLLHTQCSGLHARSHPPPPPARYPWQVLLATEDKGLALRATEHSLTCVAAAQLAAAVQDALVSAPWSAQHDRELALLLFAPGYQQAALGVSFASTHSRESYAAFAERLQQPLERVLLAATWLLAGDPTTAAAAASCWDGVSAAAGPQQPSLQDVPAAGAARRSEARRSSSVEQSGGAGVGHAGAGSGSGSGSDAEGTGTPEPPDGGGSAAAAGDTSDEEAQRGWQQGRQQGGQQDSRAQQADEEEDWDWSWSDSKQAFIRNQRAATVPQALPAGRKLLRIVSNPAYCEKVRICHLLIGCLPACGAPVLAPIRLLSRKHCQLLGGLWCR